MLKQIVSELCTSLTNNSQREKVQNQIENMSKEQEDQQKSIKSMDCEKEVLPQLKKVLNETSIS